VSSLSSAKAAKTLRVASVSRERVRVAMGPARVAAGLRLVGTTDRPSVGGSTTLGSCCRVCGGVTVGLAHGGAAGPTLGSGCGGSG